MIRPLACLLVLVCASPVLAEDAPAPSINNPPPLTLPQVPGIDAASQANPWTGLSMGAGVMGVSGFGKGRGGFGGDAFLSYSKELDNNWVIGVRGSTGYMPSPTAFGPRGYNFAMAEAVVGYDMGKFMPYLTVGAGSLRGSNFGGGLPGLSSLNNLGSGTGPSASMTKVGAGFTYAITDRLHVGVEVSTVQMRGAPMMPQPGALP